MSEENSSRQDEPSSSPPEREIEPPSPNDDEEDLRTDPDHEDESEPSGDSSGWPEGIPRPDFTSMRLRMFNTSCFFYVAMGLVGIWWMSHQGIIHPRLSLSGQPEAVTRSLLMGAGVAVFVILLGYAVQQITDWAKAFEREFAPLLNVFSYAQVPLLAFTSAAGEELFFRGALQESLGLYTAALIFGFIHVPWKKILLPWPIFALIIGLVFGWIVKWTGSLYGPFLGHFLINLINIIMIKQRHPMDEDEIIDQLFTENGK